MADTFLADLDQVLNNCISTLDEIHSLFVLNPDSDFTRTLKITFSETIRFMIEFQNKSLPNEVMDFFGHSLAAPTTAAFIQQRDKILIEGWDYLFHLFNQECSKLQFSTYRGYRLLACDGSDSNIYRNTSDEETFIHQGALGYNMIHINAFYDLNNHTYYDFEVQGKKKIHEREALNTMVDRYNDSTPAIFIGDRGYESFNTFAHIINKNQKFIIRIKDIDRNGILSSYNLPNTEFDEYVQTKLTRRHTKETLENPQVYTILSTYTDFDFIEEQSQCFDIEFRIVRFMTSAGNYICVATNLSEEEFPLAEIKVLYKMRWNEETSFRELKYTIGLSNWHSRKYDSIIKELNARMILYNYCQMAVNHAVVITADTTKHPYKINFATAVNICRAYLKDGGDENEMMLLIQRHLTAVRPNRNFPLKLHPKRYRDFMYRTA